MSRSAERMDTTLYFHENSCFSTLCALYAQHRAKPSYDLTVLEHMRRMTEVDSSFKQTGQKSTGSSVSSEIIV